MLQSQTGRPPRAGYSLVELLVVIGILAVLTALLLPVVATARRAAGSVACLATVRDWGVAFQAYVTANHGRSFVMLDQGASANPPLWWEQLEPFHPEVERTLLCPEATDPANAHPVNAFQAWGPMHLYPEPGRVRMSYVGSYGINGWLYRPAGGPPGAAPVVGPIRLPARRSARIPVIFDSAHFHIAPRDSDPSDFDPDGPITPLGIPSMRAVALRRHRNGVNVGFVDGHAEHVSLSRLWTLQWSEDFVSRHVTLPD